MFYLISDNFCDSQSGALQQDTQCLDSEAGPNQHCPEELGMISQMEVESGLTVGSVGPGLPSWLEASGCVHW